MADEIDFSTSRAAFGAELLPNAGQAERLAWLIASLPPRDLYFLQDGSFSVELFREAAQSYINGQFISAVVLGFSFLERTIAGRLHYVGASTAAGKSADLIQEAFAKGWLSAQEKEQLHQLRKLRNPVIHFREGFEHPDIAAILQAKTLPQYLEGAAKSVMGAAIHVANKTAI